MLWDGNDLVDRMREEELEDAIEGSPAVDLARLRPRRAAPHGMRIERLADAILSRVHKINAEADDDAKINT